MSEWCKWDVPISSTCLCKALKGDLRGGAWPVSLPLSSLWRIVDFLRGGGSLLVCSDFTSDSFRGWFHHTCRSFRTGLAAFLAILLALVIVASEAGLFTAYSTTKEAAAATMTATTTTNYDAKKVMRVTKNNNNALTMQVSPTPYPRWCGGQPLTMLPFKDKSLAADLWHDEAKGFNKTKKSVPTVTNARPATSGAAALKKCIDQPEHCGAQARDAARAMASIKRFVNLKTLNLGPVKSSSKTTSSCAVVGNAGHIIKGVAPYGKFIDAHDEVIRFNTAGTLNKWVGMKTTVRFLNKAKAQAVCTTPSRLPEFSKSRRKSMKMLVCWHKDNRRAMAACLKQKMDLHAIALSAPYHATLLSVYRSFGADLAKLGFRGSHSSSSAARRHELTSGMQAILTFARMFTHVDVYGMTSWEKSLRGPDQYSGRSDKRSTGRRVHDWKLESGITRLLHAAGIVTVCSA